MVPGRGALAGLAGLLGSREPATNAGLSANPRFISNQVNSGLPLLIAGSL